REFAASRGGCRPAGPSAGGAFVGGGSPLFSKNASLSAGGGTGGGGMAGNRRRVWGWRRVWGGGGQSGRTRAPATAPAAGAGSPALLSGHLFDNRGNRMSPTHANKGGARYRYYVSQAVLQKQSQPPGLVGRVPAAEIEALVVAALRSHLSANGAGEQLPDNDR